MDKSKNSSYQNLHSRVIPVSIPLIAEPGGTPTATSSDPRVLYSYTRRLLREGHLYFFVPGKANNSTDVD